MSTACRAWAQCSTLTALAAMAAMAALHPRPAHAAPRRAQRPAPALTPATARRRDAAAVPPVQLRAPAAGDKAPGPEAAPAAQIAELLGRVQAIEDRLQQTEDDNAALRRALAQVRAAKPAVSSLSLSDGVRLRLGGYADLGFFKPTGDGVSYARDEGKRHFPEFADLPWVFAGDPWGTPVNAQGDPADLGLDRTNLPRYDPIASHGKSSFVANLFNLDLVASLGQSLLFEGSVNFEPRQGELGSTGDALDVDLLYLEWLPLSGRDLHVFVGKFESTFGIEYRTRKAPDRFGVTPSLVSRYTTGTPTGLKVRGALFDKLITYNLALTNGAVAAERFGHFFNEIAKNEFKTVSLRLSIGGTVGALFVEAGGSGLVGAQAAQGRDDVLHWQAGADLRARYGDFNLRGEYVRVVANRDRVAGTPWLDVHGMYAEATYQALPWLGALARFDLRRGLLFAETNLYVSDEARLTGALRFDISFNVVAKLEYLHVFERAGEGRNEGVFTSSAVFKF